MTTRAYISTLDSNIKAKQQERTLLEQQVQEFLNQGGKIKIINTDAHSPKGASMWVPNDPHTEVLPHEIGNQV